MSPASKTGTDEYTLLCERCGYIVEGLPTEGTCPECGKPIAESLPERRVGSPWQRNPGLASLLRTWLSCLTQPSRVLDQLAPGLPSRRMHVWNASSSAFLCSIGLLAYIGRVTSFAIDEQIVEGLLEIMFFPMLSVLGVVALTMLVYASVLLITEIEARGLEAISRLRGTRITPAIARRISDLAGVGSVVGGGVFALIGIVSLIAFDSSEELPLGGVYASGLVVVATALLFSLIFVLLGLRQLRYANRVRPPARSQAPGG